MISHVDSSKYQIPNGISTKKYEQKMFKSSAVTAVTIIVDNSREGPFWLELKDYRQCNPSTSSNWHSPVHLLHPPMSTFFFNFQFNSFPPCQSSVTRFLCSSILLLSVQPLYMILRKLYLVRFNWLFRDWILRLEIIFSTQLSSILGKFNSRLLFFKSRCQK